MTAVDPPTNFLHDGERWLTLGGVRQWVRVAGVLHQTVPLLCLHGGPGGNHWVFERTVGPGLETARTVIYHEQRGSGRSDAPEGPSDYSVAGLVSDLLDRLALPARLFVRWRPGTAAGPGRAGAGAAGGGAGAGN
jgi:proline iminopeptidase